MHVVHQCIGGRIHHRRTPARSVMRSTSTLATGAIGRTCRSDIDHCVTVCRKRLRNTALPVRASIAASAARSALLDLRVQIVVIGEAARQAHVLGQGRQTGSSAPGTGVISTNILGASDGRSRT
jgi:hypothetical protein